MVKLKRFLYNPTVLNSEHTVVSTFTINNCFILISSNIYLIKDVSHPLGHYENNHDRQTKRDVSCGFHNDDS